MTKKRDYLLPRLSVDRPVTVVMILTALLVVGYIAYTLIPLNLVPRGRDDKRLWVWIPYPNASPEETERSIVLPLEAALATLGQVKEFETAGMRERAIAKIYFRADADMSRAWGELTERMDRLAPELPYGPITVGKWDSDDDDEIMWMNINFQPGVTQPMALVESQLKPMLERIDGVANIKTWVPREEVLIQLDQRKVESHKANLIDVVDKLRNQNFIFPSGTVRDGGKRLYVRSVASLDSLEEIRDLVLDSEFDLRLSEVANVHMQQAKKDWYNRTNGNEAMWMGVQRTAVGNVVAVTTAIRGLLEELKSDPVFDKVNIEIVWDQGEYIVKSIENLKKSGLWGGLFAALILFFFLRAVRMTMLIVLAIPLSILVTITVLYFAGWSLNIATMMGLMLSLGLVVDNGIVIVENIYRKQQSGTGARRASIEGAGEVGLAVTIATLTTVVVFLPLILMSDEESFAFWMFRIGLPVIVGLLASLFIALIFIPLAAQRLSTEKEKEELRLIAKLRDRYLRCLRFALNHRLDGLIVVLLLMGSIYIPIEGMKKTDQQNRRSWIHMRFDVPPALSVEALGDYMDSVEDTLMNHRDEYNADVVRIWYTTGRGGAGVVLKEGENLEWYSVAFYEIVDKLGLREKTGMEYEDVVKDIKSRIPSKPGIVLTMNRERTGQDASVTLNLYGHETRLLTALAEEVERRLLGIEGLERVYTEMAVGGNSELQVRLDRAKLDQYGIEARTISSNLGIRWPSNQLRGVELSRFRTDRGELVMRMSLQEEDISNMEHLRNLSFPTVDGKQVQLKSLGSFYVNQSIGRIRRYNRQTMVAVTATATKEESENLFEQIDLAMEGFEMPRGYRWDKGARYVRMQESDASQQFAIVLAVTFVFLLMGLLFESFVLPLSVIIAIPFSFLGVYWTLYATGTTFDDMSRIGTVILVGVVVNNAIVLVDLTNRLRSEGLKRFDALIEAGRHRFRPILMTTFTTIFGLVPMAIGNSKVIGANYAPLGRTMMGGLLASMVLTLLIVPLCYTLLDDVREFSRKIVASALRRRSTFAPHKLRSPS